MKPGIPWSVKGIEQQARAAAKQAARRQGMTIGEWLNTVILDSAEGGDDLERRYRRGPYRPKPVPAGEHGEGEEVTLRLEEIAEQLHTIARHESDTALARQTSPEDEATLRAIVERLDAHEQQTSSTLGAMQERLEQVSERLGRTSEPRLPERPEEVPGYPALEGALRNIIEHIEVSETRTRDCLKSLQDRLAEMMGHTGNASAASVGHLEERVAELSERMTGSDASQRADLAEVREVEQRLRALVEEAKRVGESTDLRDDLSRLQGEIDSLNQRFDDLQVETVSQRDVESLRLEIEQLTTTVSQASGHAFADLERRVEALSTRIAEPDPATERQLAAFGERIAATEQRLEHLATIERSVTQLAQSVEASRTATAEAGDDARSSEGSPELKALEDGLNAVRASAALADRRTQETLQAVHETLEQIVAKLAELEAEDVPDSDEPAEVSADESAEASAVSPSEELAQPAVEQPREMAGEDATTFGAAEPETALSPIPEDIATQPQGETDDSIATAVAAEAPAVTPEPLAEAPEAAPHKAEPSEASEGAASDADTPAEPVGEPVREDYIAAARRAAQMAAMRNQNPMASGFNRFSQRLTGGSAQPCKPAAETAPRRGFASSLLASLRRGKAKTSEEAKASGKGAKSARRKRLIFAGLVLLAAVSAYGAHRSGALPSLDVLPGPVSAPAAGPAEVEKATLPQTIDGKPDAARQLAEELPGEIAPQALRQAAARGDAKAQFAIASRYLEGKVVARDEERAAQWYKLAAMQGFAAAQYRLGSMYEHGRGMPVDRTAAQVWYEEAAVRGNIKAMHNLAVLYSDASTGGTHYELAADWFRKAAERGVRDSQFNLAVLSEQGLGVPQSAQQAVFWYSLAAAQGDQEAAAKAKEMEASLAPDRARRVRERLMAWRPLPANRAANFVPIGDPSGRS